MLTTWALVLKFRQCSNSSLCQVAWCGGQNRRALLLHRAGAEQSVRLRQPASKMGSAAGRSVSQRRRQFARMGTAMIVNRNELPIRVPTHDTTAQQQTAAPGRAQRRLGDAFGKFRPTSAGEVAGIDRESPRQSPGTASADPPSSDQSLKRRPPQRRRRLGRARGGLAPCGSSRARHVAAPGARFSLLCLSSFAARASVRCIFCGL